MKKIKLCFLALCVCYSAYAGSYSEPVSVSEQPQYYWEVAGRYSHSCTDIDANHSSPSIHTWGIDLTGLYRVQGNHYLTLRLGYAQGEVRGFELYQFSLMPGYRYEAPLGESMRFYAGAGLGVGVSVLSYPGIHAFSHSISSEDDMANLVYSLEIGLKYEITPSVDVGAALIFHGGISPFHDAEFEHASEEQSAIGIRFGFSGAF